MDHGPVRRLRHAGGDERALPGPARGRRRRASRSRSTCRRRWASTPTIRSPTGEVGRVGRRARQPRGRRDADGGDPARVDQRRCARPRTRSATSGRRWFVALAEQRGVDPDAFGIFIQNDVLKEYIARGTQIFAPEPSLRLITDVVEYTARTMPALGAARDLRLPHPRVRRRRGAGDRVHLRERDRLPRRGPRARAHDRRRRADAVRVPLARDRAPRGGREVAGGAAGVGTPDPRAVRSARPAHRAAAHLRLHRRLEPDGAAAAEQRRPRDRSRRLAAALAGVQTMHVCAYDEAVGVPTAGRRDARAAHAAGRSRARRASTDTRRSARRLATRSRR